MSDVKTNVDSDLTKVEGLRWYKFETNFSAFRQADSSTVDVLEFTHDLAEVLEKHFGNIEVAVVFNHLLSELPGKPDNVELTKA